MGKCSDCLWFEKQGVNYERDRYESNWCSKFKMKVNPNAVCDRFSEKETPKNSNYTGGNSGGCFLTSACVDYMGKPDDCEELTKLRTFRDNYMRATTEGNKLVNEYYRVAPRIVEKINGSEKKNDYYCDIYDTISSCLKAIDENRNNIVMSLYKEMVNKYKHEFSIS